MKPVGNDGAEQVVFYVWGIGSYHGSTSGGVFGTGINKNIQDCNPGDQLYCFGFSRGAYTVGALGIPIHVLGFLSEKHVFHDTKIDPNVVTARHALSIDERRGDFEPTIWRRRSSTDLQKIQFVGVHLDVGGGYPPDGNCTTRWSWSSPPRPSGVAAKMVPTTESLPKGSACEC